MTKPTLWAHVWFRKWDARARYCRASVLLALAVFRYHALCFRHLGWRRALIFLLEFPEQLKAIGFALFTHRKIPKIPSQSAGSPE